MSIPRGHPLTDLSTPVQTSENAGTLDATHRCDRCGAQAYVLTRHPVTTVGRVLPLLWCKHHYEAHEGLLARYKALDERFHLTAA